MYSRLLAIVLLLATTSVSMADDDEKNDGKESKLKTLAVHQTIARFEGAPYRLCRGRTARCPRDCGDSGEFATFRIVDYLKYEKPGKYGDPRQQQFRFQISDFNRKPKGDPQLTKVAADLEVNDLVLLEWRHLYGEIKPGLISPTRPVSVLRKLTEAEAERLREKAVAKAPKKAPKNPQGKKKKKK